MTATRKKRTKVLPLEPATAEQMRQDLEKLIRDNIERPTAAKSREVRAVRRILAKKR